MVPMRMSNEKIYELITPFVPAPLLDKVTAKGYLVWSKQEGDVFKKGAVLLTLEQESIQAQRDAVYSEIESANEALKNAGVQYSQSIVSPNSGGMFGGAGGMGGGTNFMSPQTSAGSMNIDFAPRGF